MTPPAISAVTLRRGGLSPRVMLATLAGSIAVGGLLVLPAARRAADAYNQWETTRGSPTPIAPPPTQNSLAEAVGDNPGEATRFLAQVADAARRAGCRLTHWENIPAPERDLRATVIASRTRAETVGDWAALSAFVRHVESGPRRVTWIRCEVVRTDDRSRVLLGRWEMERYLLREPTEPSPKPPTDVAVAPSPSGPPVRPVTPPDRSTSTH